MEIVSNLVTVTLPNYLSNLPIPKSLSGFVHLSGTQWLSLVPFVGTVSLIVYVSVQAFTPKPPEKKPRVNQRIQKESSKVVNMFPLCDGSHTKHNEETGDNVGPLVLKRKSAS
ncbi:hypothetical protein KUTeg_003517 [Tegillarca granosa]|uniref:Iron sulphur domain-containing protein n=1 Tax=Tegillarca granosa TaxID=220873 RepID=A0ABQ9FMB7_TEGGR|nr:hypothetical protein KUTeg_003517 [Tegillarca granosa]